MDVNGDFDCARGFSGPKKRPLTELEEQLLTALKHLSVQCTHNKVEIREDIQAIVDAAIIEAEEIRE